MIDYPKLLPNRFYHIYSRGNNREDIFREARNHAYFMKKYTHYIEPVADTFVYCLMKNHFHLLVQIKGFKEGSDAPGPEGSLPDPTLQFSHLLNSYAKAINRAYGRTGSLFQKRFGRIEVDTEDYARYLVRYIHQNPQRHGFVGDFRSYPYSSYHVLISDKPTPLKRALVLEWFGGVENFRVAHEHPLGVDDLPECLEEAFEEETASKLYLA